MGRSFPFGLARRVRALPAAVLCLALAGCAVERYKPLPLAPAATAQSLEKRSLDQPELRSCMERQAGAPLRAWPIKVWTLGDLIPAGWCLNSDVAVAEAQLQSAAAAVTTAAMKPNPMISGQAGYETTFQAPYLFGLGFSLPIETAGKRGYRVAAANHYVEATRIHVGEAAWAVRDRVRTALAGYLVTERAQALLERQARVQASATDLLRKQVEAGEIGSPAWNDAEIQLAGLRVSLAGAAERETAARASIAAALGVPLDALDGKRFLWPGFDQPPPQGSLPLATMEHSALLNRMDVRRALEDYRAAQSQLQLEIARQYPDLELGPGYNYEEGAHLIAFQPSLTLPLRNRNQGPIAEAKAARQAAAVNLIATQQHVLAACDQALANFRGARRSLTEIDRSLLAAGSRGRDIENHRLQAGEADRLAWVETESQLLAIQRTRLEALATAQSALGALEDALQAPLDGGDSASATPRIPEQSGAGGFP